MLLSAGYWPFPIIFTTTELQKAQVRAQVLTFFINCWFVHALVDDRLMLNEEENGAIQMKAGQMLVHECCVTEMVTTTTRYPDQDQDV